MRICSGTAVRWLGAEDDEGVLRRKWDGQLLTCLWSWRHSGPYSHRFGARLAHANADERIINPQDRAERNGNVEVSQEILFGDYIYVEASIRNGLGP